MRVLAIVIALAGIAHADGTTSDAERLFQEGRALLKDGKHDEACAKFEQSILKDPRAVGTLMNLGLCNERRGKIATALKFYQEAFDRATEANLPTQRQTAQEQIAALTSQIPIVVIKYAAAPLAGQRLLVDDVVIAADRSELPIDPGTHDVVLTAPGRLQYETQVNVKPADRKVVQLPILEVPSSTTIIKRSATRRIGKIVTLGGGVLVVTGLAFAGVAKHRYDLQFQGANAACGGTHGFTSDGVALCSEYGAQRVDSARTLGTAATITGGVGLVAIGTGLVLWLSSPSDETPKPFVELAGHVDRDSAGFAISGRF